MEEYDKEIQLVNARILARMNAITLKDADAIRPNRTGKMRSTYRIW